MTFTYNLASSDPATLNVSLVRLELGDTTDGSGVRPDNSNLTDEELAVWLAREEDDVLRAAAAACEALSRMWANAADLAIGPRHEALGAVSERWATAAMRLRRRRGGTGSSFSTGFTRSDGYADASGLSDYVAGVS